MHLGAKLLVAMLGGTLLSLLIPLVFIKYQVHSDHLWIVMALGWVVFSVGRDDLFRMIAATVFDAGLYTVIIYSILHLLDVGMRRMTRKT